MTKVGNIATGVRGPYLRGIVYDSVGAKWHVMYQINTTDMYHAWASDPYNGPWTSTLIKTNPTNVQTPNCRYDSAGNLHMVVQDNVTIWYVRRTPAGVFDQSKNIASGAIYTNPIIAIDENNVIWVFFQNRNTPIRTIEGVYSTDNGVTFTAPFTVISGGLSKFIPSAICIGTRVFMITGDSATFLVFTRDGPGTVFTQESFSDAGATHTDFLPQVGADFNGNLLIAYTVLIAGQNNVRFRTRDTAGVYSAFTQIFGPIAKNCVWPMMGIDRNGSYYLIFQRRDSGIVGPILLFTKRQGGPWTGPSFQNGASHSPFPIAINHQAEPDLFGNTLRAWSVISTCNQDTSEVVFIFTSFDANRYETVQQGAESAYGDSRILGLKTSGA